MDNNRKDMKEILIYSIDDYFESGGGLYLEYFEYSNAENERLERINQLTAIHGNKFKIEVAGSLHEKKYKPVEVVAKYERI
jgi:hypothetical protein